MAGDIFNARIKNKRDTAANWERVATTFQPLDGELIVVDTSAGATRFKVGRYDEAKGRLLFYNEIPFTDEALYTSLNDKITTLTDAVDDKVSTSIFTSALNNKSDKDHDHKTAYSAVQFVRW